MSEQQASTQNSNFPVTPVQKRSEQKALRKKIRRLPYFANRPYIGEAELSTHNTEQQASCEQKRR